MNAEEVKRLLPWYVVDALEPAERREVEAELSNSAELRRELAQVRALGEAVRASDVEVPEFRAAMLDEALQRIDQLERPDSRPKATVTVLDRFRRTVTGDWRSASGITRFALAAQFALIFVMAGFLLMPSKREETVFDTVSAPDRPHANGRSVGAGPRFNVRFAPEASAGRIEGLLAEQDLQIVSGPSSTGMFVVTASERANAEQVLSRLHEAGDVVGFAELKP